MSHELIDPANVPTIERYRKVAGAINRMFKALSIRTNGEGWRIDGRGACGEVDRDLIESQIEGPAREDFIKLREERNAQIPGESKCGCPYHREGIGCILGDLKGPICLAHIDNPQELQERFGIDADQTTFGIDLVTKRIIAGKEDDLFVEAAVHAVDSMIEHIEGFPILHPEEVK